MIEDNLLSMYKIFFQEKNKWRFVSDQMKEKYFFIFNRFLSKKFPGRSQLFNSKSIDKVVAMDLWFHFLQKEKNPTWFWPKSKKDEKESNISKNDFNSLMKKFSLNKKEDLEYLIRNHSEEVEEEIKLINLNNKDKK